MVEIRQAATTDLSSIHRVWWDTGSAPTGWQYPWFSHMLAIGRLVVATVDDRVVGFAGVRWLELTQVLSDCYVTPAFQGQGVGSRMLDEILDPNSPMMTLASQDPKAKALYQKWGMEPIVDCLYLNCPATGEAKPGPAMKYGEGLADLDYLVHDVGCRMIGLGQASWAAVTEATVEYSVVGPGDDQRSAFAELFAQLGRPVRLEMAADHPALDQLGGVESDRDTLMATPGAELPDYRRITFNGDLLDVGY